MRKLVSVQTISDVQPIEGADRIETATVGGWRIVVGKGEFAVGDRVAYFEIDSFLPESNPAYASFQARGQRTVAHDGADVTGHVLKTAKLRGVISQGLVLSLDALGVDPDTEVSTDITDVAGVFKYEPPLPTGTNIIGPFDSRFAPKTDAVRLQNLTDYWDLIKTVEWEPTVKVDGTSQTLVNDGGTIRIFGRNWELAPDAAGMEIAARNGLVEALEPGVAIQAELVGGGIQGNKLKLSNQRLIVFAVWQDGVKLARSEWPEAALQHATPVLGEEYKPQNFTTVEDLVTFVDGIKGNITKDIKDEGVVFHPVDPATMPKELASVLDRNGNFKVISNAWLVKHKE